MTACPDTPSAARPGDESRAGVLETPVSQLGLSVRSHNCLKRAGFETVRQLLLTQDRDLLRVKNLGQKSLIEIQRLVMHFLLATCYSPHQEGLNAEQLPTIAQSSDSQGRFRLRAIKVKQLYDLLGTYEAVAKQLGVTRERVRQILHRGTARGWFELEIHGKRGWAKKLFTLQTRDIRDAILKSGSVHRVAKQLGLPSHLLMRLCDARGLDMEELRREHKERKTLGEYKEIVQELGYHPSASILQKRKKWRAVGARIQRLWGSIAAFRRSFGIEARLVTERPWLHKQHGEMPKK